MRFKLLKLYYNFYYNILSLYFPHAVSVFTQFPRRVSVPRVFEHAYVCEERERLRSLADSGLNASSRLRDSRATGTSVSGNLTSSSARGSASLLQIEPSYFGHPVERFSILPSRSRPRAPACHSARGCFRFRRPKGNNPSLRSPDHVEDRVSFPEYYGFLYSALRCMCTYVYIYTVYTPYVSLHIGQIYMCMSG